MSRKASMSSRPRHAGVHFPPPFVYAGGFFAGLALERWLVRVHLAPAQWRGVLVVAGWCAVIAGVAFAASGIITLLAKRTTVIPNRPARVVVRSGPYRWSRNPMYVGLSVLYIGLACLSNMAWPLLFLPIVLFAIQRFVIMREERYLASAFGEDYAAYCLRVRRWL